MDDGGSGGVVESAGWVTGEVVGGGTGGGAKECDGVVVDCDAGPLRGWNEAGIGNLEMCCIAVECEFGDRARSSLSGRGLLARCDMIGEVDGGQGEGD